MTQQTIPTWARHQLSQDAFAQIEAAIAKAEDHTCGEIIPIIVRQSATVRHVPLSIFLLSWLTCEILDFAHVLALNFEHWAIEFIYFFIALGSSAFFARFPAIQRMFTPKEDRDHQVEMRAEVEFYEAGLNRTRGRTGILIFISLMEHRVTVLADEAISSKLVQDTWSGVVQDIIAGIKSKDLAAGLIAGIERCGRLLAEHFPRPEDDTNELRDHLIIKE